MSKKKPPLSPLVCTGRQYDRNGQPMPGAAGEPCGCMLVPNPKDGHDQASYECWARVKGWRFGPAGDGKTRHVMCPSCARPDPATLGVLRELRAGVTR